MATGTSSTIKLWIAKPATGVIVYVLEQLQLTELTPVGVTVPLAPELAVIL